jgi:quercetin dioxygenase-like cupin family protein
VNGAARKNQGSEIVRRSHHLARKTFVVSSGEFLVNKNHGEAFAS